jgi:hypothetical protein
MDKRAIGTTLTGVFSAATGNRKSRKVFIAAKSPLNQVQFSLQKNFQAELAGDEFAAAGLQNHPRNRHD